MNITITEPMGIYYGVYNDSGDWKQADELNDPTALAILFEIPETPGRYNGDIIEEEAETYGRTESVFNVKFEPEEEGFFSDNFETENGSEKVDGAAFDLKADFGKDVDDKIIDWYK